MLKFNQYFIVKYSILMYIIMRRVNLIIGHSLPVSIPACPVTFRTRAK